MRLRSVGLAVIAVVIVLAGRAPASAADDLRVVLQVQSKSWIAGSTFNADLFRERCHAAGVELLPPGSSGAGGTAVVTYAETKGPGFSMFGVGEPVGFGTDIAFKITLLGPGARTLMTIAAASETAPGLEKEEFHESARLGLQDTPAHNLACAAMAAALGARTQALRLLPWAVLDAQGLTVLERLGFRPDTPEERAYVAVAKRDFTAVQGLGAVAVEPLLLLFENSAEARNGVGRFPLTPDNVRALTRALATLAFATDERVPDVLTTFLSDYGDYRAKDDASVVPLLRLVMQTLGRVGTVFTIPVLDEWRADNGPLARDAATAADAIRKRVSIE